MIINIICWLLFSFGIIIMLYIYRADSLDKLSEAELDLGFNISQSLLILSTTLKVLTL